MKQLQRIAILLIVALPVWAQSADSPAPPASAPPPLVQQPSSRSSFRSALRNYVELQVYNFGNFYQAREGAPEQNVPALGAAYRAAYAMPGKVPDLYGGATVVRYSGDASDTSITAQFGLSKYEGKHWYDVYVDHTWNGYSFDVEETRASANITSLWGHYSYAINDDWRVGADTYLDWTRFDVDTGFESDYRSLAAHARYSGFGDLFEPRVGYNVGVRDSADPDDELDDRYWFVQVDSEPHPKLDLSLRYRGRTLDYTNVDRTEDRDQILLRARVKQTGRVVWSAWYRIEDIQSSVPGQNFDRDTGYVGLSFEF